MAAIKVILFVSLVSVLYEESEGSCSSSLDCPGLQVCCNTEGGFRSSECRRRCGYVRDSCIVDSDCIDSFCCNNVCRGSCVGWACLLGTNCGNKTYCCNEICRESCDGQSCYFDDDCGDKKYCCKDTCRDSCIGHRCIFNNHCGDDNDYCCNDKCQKGECSLASWVIVMIVCVVGGVAGIIVTAFCCYRSVNDSSLGIIVAAPLTTMPATTVVGSSNVSSYAPTSEGPPPHYQP